MGKNKIGVYYDLNDYAGFFRRFISLLIDFVFILFILFFFLLIKESLDETNIVLDNLVFVWLIFMVIYFTILKASSLRTIGYRLMGIKIVTLKGQKPNFVTMLFRFFLWLFGPFQLPYDILWLINDEHRQCMRDKCAGTYVIKKNAKPVGEGNINVINYLILGFNLLFEVVTREN